ncbi:LAFA_0E06062g1_1 [Lachancea sp. 'fantastica']|nr:LAFA_0E06062g1_1 [Lachancea sp. 'fantastica']
MSNEGAHVYENIALDEEAYARYVCKNAIQSMPENHKIPVLTIPRSSFTAFRLTYASPVEISQSSKSVLLGGVPNLWYIQHKNNFVRSMYQFAYKNVTRRVQQAGKYANFRRHRSGRKFRRPGSTTPRNLRLSKEQNQDRQSATEIGLEGLQGEVCLEDSPTRDSISSEDEANSVTVAEIEGLVKSSSSSSQGMESKNYRQIPRIRERQCSQSSKQSLQSQINSKIPETHSDASISELDTSNAKHEERRNSCKHAQMTLSRDLQNFEDHESLIPATNPRNALRSTPSVRDSIQSESYYSADDGYISENQTRKCSVDEEYSSTVQDYFGGNEDTLAKDARNLNQRFQESGSENGTISESFPDTLSTGPNMTPRLYHTDVPRLIKDSPETADLSSVRFKEEPKPKHLQQHSMRDRNTRINTAYSASSFLSTSSDEEQVVVSRDECQSNAKCSLKVLSPQPYALGRQESVNMQALNRRKMLKEVKSFVTKTGKRIHLNKLDKLHFDLSSVMGRDSRLSQRLFTKYRAGEVVKMEKMLVFIKSSKSTRGPLLNFSDVEPIDTRVVERWKEYIVVARATGRSESPLYIQFYRDSKIPRVETNAHTETYKANSMDFMLDSSCIVDFYNTLDKTIHVIKSSRSCSEEGKGTNGENLEDVGKLRIYILRCGSFASAEKWLLFLRQSLGHVNESGMVTVNVPEAGFSLEIPMSRNLRRRFENKAFTEEEQFKVLMMPRGYKPLGYPLARYLEVVILGKLLECGFKATSLGWIQANTLTGFCWKHYDRLEWCPGDQYDSIVGGVSLQASHLLEYRTLSHYPRSVRKNSRETLVEPPGIEGFLMKCTDRYGKEIEKVLHTAYYRFSYFFTSDSLLFFMSSFKGAPPLPNEMISRNGACAYDVQRMKANIASVPKIFEHNPYPLDLNSHIEWLNSKLMSEEFDEKDSIAFAAMWRKIALILKAEKIIDLTEVTSVSKLDVHLTKTNILRYKILARANNFVWKASNTLEDTLKSTIVLSMRNGLSVKLLASSPELAEEWVSRLNSLRKYWKYRKADDVKNMWSAKVENLRTLKIPESEESNISQITPKWVTDRGVANEEVHNISAQALTRPLMQSGVLYQKRHKHASFKKFFALLIPGFLILYRYHKSAKSSHSKTVVDHRHYLTIPIEECYVYSGNLTSLDLLQRDKQFDRLNSGNNSLPRVYPDGWRSSEDESTRCFTLWFGTKGALSNYNSLFSHSPDNELHGPDSSHSAEPYSIENNGALNTSSSDGRDLSMEENLQKKTGSLRLASRLGVAGSSLVFMARSRQERDQWALKLHYELGRLRAGDDDP